jgi:hypothetical protein
MSSTDPALAGLEPAPGTEGPALPPDVAVQPERPVGKPEMVETDYAEPPTVSHELATADHEEKGAAQLNHDQTEVRDLGWSHPVEDAPAPLVGGLPNEQLWTLIRRFNKACCYFQVKLLRSQNANKVPIANVPCQEPTRTTTRRS